MKILGIQNIQYNRTNNVHFGGISSSGQALKNNKTISQKSIKLVNDLNVCIEKEWAAIKKGDVIASKPIFRTVDDFKVITIEPIYSQKFPALMIEIEEDNVTEKILVNRNNPNEFIYEKNIETDHGYATLKRYDSRSGKDNSINRYVDSVIEKNIEKTLSDKKWDRILNRFEKSDD